jgi:lauroyl/myristoyl acyltransferase
VAIRNLGASFGDERSPAEVRALARENFKRLGENYCCAVKTAAMSWSALKDRLEFVGVEKLGVEGRIQSRVFAVGHFGNFELYPRGKHSLPQYQFATTYRALKQQGLNRLLLELRQLSGCLLFERRVDGDALRAAMASQNLILGFLSDQHAGSSGAWLPFFGRICSTTTAPAVFAQRYRLPLHVAICYRTGPGRWRIEVGDEIPTFEGEERRSPREIMVDVNQAFEIAVRRDPANWFWVHNRWKPRKPMAPDAKPGMEEIPAAVRNPK